MYIVYQVDLNKLLYLDPEFGLFEYFSSDFIFKFLKVLPIIQLIIQ